MPSTRIMVVEDDMAVSESIQMTARSLGYEICCAVTSGEEAIEKAPECRPDVVLMDIDLAGSMDGLEAAGRIRTFLDVPVIFLTACADDERLERAKPTEPFGYLIRPREDRELKATIEMALYKAKMESKLRANEQRLATILGCIGDAVISTDMEGKVTSMSPVAESLTGWQGAKALGRHIEDVFKIIDEESQQRIENPVSKALRDGTITGPANHTALIAQDGREIPIDDSVAPIRDARGHVTGMVLVFRDVAERKSVEKKLLESRDKIAAVIESITDGFFSMDGDLVVTHFNEAAGRMLGRSREEVLNRCLFDAFPEARGSIFEEKYTQAARERVSLHFETNFGVEPYANWYDVRVYPRGKDGISVYFQVTTERKKAEQDLRESENRYRTLVENLPQRIFLKDGNSVYISCNTSFADQFMIAPHEIVGKTDFFFFPDEFANKFRADDRRIMDAGKPEEYEETYIQDGRIRWASTVKIPMRDEAGNVSGVLGIFSDITDRKAADEELRQSRRDWVQIFQAIGHPTLILDSEHNILSANRSAMLSIGLSESDIIGKKCHEIFHGAGRPAQGCPMERMLTAGEFETIEMEMEALGGVFLVSCTPVFDDRGSLSKIIHIATDITHRKQAEKELARLATALEHAADAVIVTDRRGSIEYVNPAFERITQYTRQEIIGRNMRVLRSDAQDMAFYRDMWNTITSGRIWKGHIINKTKDGTLCEFETTISPITDSSGKIVSFVSLNRDVTQEVMMESRLRQAQKMEAIGTLAGGIAHDFNNILGAILGYTELTRIKIPQGTVEDANLEQVVKASYRAKDLVKQILLFSRKGPQERKPVEMSHVVHEALKLIRASLPTTIEIRQDIMPPSQSRILADPTQIHQVLMNLCTNAAHAMRQRGGVLTVSLTDLEVLSDEAHSSPELGPGAYVKLTVRDTGQGMDRSILERIFDPFFTTKESGEGTGMGLAVVHGIVRSHEGTVTVRSEPGRGSTFDVYFPKIEPRQNEEIEIFSAIPKGKGRILFVDDEQALVRLGGQMLRSLGYEVVEKTRSAEALELFLAQPDRFDLVITDYTMPHMTGVELARKILSVSPHMPIILCTGFSEMITEEKAKALGIREFIMKPVARHAIAQSIARALDVQGIVPPTAAPGGTD